MTKRSARSSAILATRLNLGCPTVLALGAGSVSGHSPAIDAVVVATPIDLRHLIRIEKPTVRVTYGLREIEGSLEDELAPV